jgi:hypothetical protein
MDSPRGSGASRIAPYRLVDLLPLKDLALRLGEELEYLELAASEVGALRSDEGLELVGANLELAGHERPRLDARRRALATAHHRLDPREHLLGVAGLRHPIVRA